MTNRSIYGIIRQKERPIGYYSEKLSSVKLKLVYEIAPPRVRRYLRAEIDHVCDKITPGDLVLDLGCGYGRALPAFAYRAGMVVGIDSSISSLVSALDTVRILQACHVVCMNAVELAIPDNTFDKVVCIQNGISAFHVDQRQLIRESIRVTRPGGIALFSSYSEKFWDHRLEWFRLQADAGLLGEIDMSRTGDGVIICEDGFKATTVTPEAFRELTSDFNIRTAIVEVDESSLFCEIYV
jgi:2-polyprenyl-6-hydroxyphenyl methylase/3-demethylubiquinone-9 3-methyltransferase